MEASFSLIKTTPKFYFPLSTTNKTKTQEKIILLYPVKPQHVQPGHHNLKLRQHSVVGRLRSSSGCGKGNTTTELKSKLEEEEKNSMEEEFAENCRDGNYGIVELMECLEREAIMGKDVGSEPMDYNRRAYIFEKSSRVFHALKESSSTPAAADS